MRKPLFGDIHVHTSRSLDAGAQDVRTTPFQAYRFAMGERIPLHPWIAEKESGQLNIKNMVLSEGEKAAEIPKLSAKPTRSLQLGRPLDFAMVSDHAEFLGEVRVCAIKELYPDAYNSKGCKALRKNLPEVAQLFLSVYMGGGKLGMFLHSKKPLKRFKYCGKKGKDCFKASETVWKEMIDSAEAVYDRSEDCKFTSFIGYEYSLAPFGGNLHRNVVFRNKRVPKRVISGMDAKHPELLWDQLTKKCLNNKKLKNEDGHGCEVLAVPHNPNLSGGRMFSRKLRKSFNLYDKNQGDFDKAYVNKRKKFEPLIEMYQHKGGSECHYYKPGTFFKQAPVIDNADEFCSFEKFPFNNLIAEKESRLEKWLTKGHALLFSRVSTYPTRKDFIRYALKRGLQLENKLGANPFKYGFIGSTDTHIGAPGASSETSFKGHGGAGAANEDTEGLSDFMSYSAGGLAVVWAEENSRDYIFDAMLRKETYATSGTRILVRFFGGWDFNENEAKSLCQNVKFNGEGTGLSGGEFVEKGYQLGVPMGSDLTYSKNKTPVFAVAALKDPGNESGKPDQIERSTPLSQIQIIKGWVDEKGKSHEKVYTVAGSPDNNAHVDLNTCMPKGPETDALCNVWRDPDFNPKERAFYYARVIENPVCRWSWLQCRDYALKSDPKKKPVDFFSETCSSKKKQKNLPKGFRPCCLHKNISQVNPKKWEKIQMGVYPPTVQERAWSSPIWYNPPKK